MTTVAILLLAAAVALGVSMHVRLPPAPFAILGGLALRVLSVPLDEALLREGLVLATAFLVFFVGAQVDLVHVRRHLRAAAAIATLQLALLAATGLAVSALGFDPWSVVYLVLAIGAGSTFLAGEVLRRRERFFDPTGRLVLGVLVVQDLIIIVALSAIDGVGEGAVATLQKVGLVAALAGAAWCVARWVAPLVLVRARLDEEERLLVLLAILFVFLGAAWRAGLPLVTGAFFAGLALSRFPAGSLVRGYVASFTDFFTAIFLVTLGHALELPHLLELTAELAFVGLMVLVRPLALLPLARRAGLPVRSAFEALALLAQCGELGLAVVLVGMQRGHVGAEVLHIVAITAVATMMLAGWLSSDAVTWQLTHRFPLRRRPGELPQAPSGHVLLIGCGAVGRALLTQLQGRGVASVVIDDDPDAVRALESAGILTLRGDGADPHLLERAGATRARAVVSTMRRMADNERLLAHTAGAPTFVRVFSQADADRVAASGGRPVIEAELAADAFVRWYDAEAPRLVRSEPPAAV